MSIKNIEHRLCCGLYDMAWLNLSAGLENIPEMTEQEAATANLRPVFRRLSEDGIAWSKAIREGDGNEIRALTDGLLGFRDDVAMQVEALTRYSSEATVLLRCLRRQAARREEPESFDTEEEVRALLGKIFEGTDQVITNLRIRSMVQAFPARMTKTRFFDMISGYLSLYKGQEDGEGLAAFCYRLRSAAAMDNGDGESMEMLESVLKPAREAALSDGEAASEELTGRLEEILRVISGCVSYLEDIARCINPMAVIGILQTLPMPVREDSTVADELEPSVALAFRKASGESVDESAYDRSLGVAHELMEQYFEPLSVLAEQETGRLQAAIDAMDDDSAAVYVPVMKATRLMSTSVFASLAEEPAPPVTQERLDACRDRLFGELEARLAGLPKSLTREWMGSVLSELPVWFESRTDVMQYMLSSLRGCRTDGERRLAVAMLRNRI